MDISTVPPEQRSALSLLIDDHRAVQALFQRFDSASTQERQAIATQACQQLTVHTQLEEEIFYPAIRGFSAELDKLLDEAKDEHAEAKAIIAKIQANSSEGLAENFKALVSGVEHHVEEEEGEMFPMVVSNAVPLEDVATKLRTRKGELA